MIIHCIKTAGIASNAYIVEDQTSKECIVIDPTRYINPILKVVKKRYLTLTKILETHVHADFVSGSLELKSACNGEPSILCSAMGGTNWTPSYTDLPVKDLDVFTFGETTIQALFTPGHTPEHLCWLIEGEALFTGDLLFYGAVGRPDLLGCKAQNHLIQQLYESLFKRLKSLDESLPIYPSHGAGSLCGKALANKEHSTLSEEWSTNIFLRGSTEKEWCANLMKDMPAAPPYFREMKRINVEGPIILKKQSIGNQELDLNAFMDWGERDAQLIDIRAFDSFYDEHIPGSINIPLEVGISTWAGWVIDYKRPVALICDTARQAEEAIKEFSLIGVDDIKGYLLDGVTKWEESGFETDSLDCMTVYDLNNAVELDSELMILDVRNDEERKRGSIQDAYHMPFGLKEDKIIEELNSQQPIAVICGGGIRSAIFSSYLQTAGFHDVTNVLGGMAAWRKAGFPVSTNH